VRKGERGTKVHFVKQQLLKEDESGETETHVILMLREYTVINVDQCDGLGGAPDIGHRPGVAT
jgi:antirestriction protein ArdC